ncbi:hypothetical protein IFT43_02070 [Oxalobacteraceae sp. CFBP 13708]|nr:hypothetical protein [Oxalobacteraceae sp. CFBP 13708]
MNENEFYLKIAYALSGCQLVEQQLKSYITDALDFIRKRLAGKLPFKMNGDDYEDAPLGRLIDVFKKLSDNETLVRDLTRFKTERNFLSHKGISHCIDPDGELFQTTAQDFEKRLSAIEKEAQRLLVAINDEGNNFRAHLWFDVIPNT